jgi:hypothetical protein
MPAGSWDDDDEKAPLKVAQMRFTEFDCPGCNANNPVDPPFGHRSEVLCGYCGMEWEVLVDEDGKLDFKEL